MKIVYLSPSGQLGGAELSLLDIMASIRAAMPEFALHLIAGSDGPLVAHALEIGINAITLPFPDALARLGDAGVSGTAGTQVSRLQLFGNLVFAMWPGRDYVRRLRQALKELEPDVIHSNGFKMHVLSIWARPAGRVPVIWHVRDYASRRAIMARLLRHLSTKCAGIVANSKSVAEDVRVVCGRRAPEVHVVYNAIDLERFSTSGATLDLDGLAQLQAAPPGTLRVGLPATFARWKGHEVFLRALSLLPSDITYRGYIIGDAIYQTAGSQYDIKELRRLSAELGLEDRIGFTGFVEDMPAVMRSLDIVVHASTEPEPFGRVIAEAMACGRALVASDAGGAAEIIENGVNALSHTPGDSASLADCINHLARNSTLMASMGLAGRATAELRFDRVRLPTELIPLYQEAPSRKT